MKLKLLLRFVERACNDSDGWVACGPLVFHEIFKPRVGRWFEHKRMQVPGERPFPHKVRTLDYIRLTEKAKKVLEEEKGSSGAPCYLIKNKRRPRWRK